MRALLDEATAEQMILLHKQLTDAAMLLWLDALQPFHPAPPAGVALARAIVSQGREAYEQAKAHPEEVAPPPPAELTDLPSVVAQVYRERFDAEIPPQEPDPARRSDLGPTPEREQAVWRMLGVLNVGVPLRDALTGVTRSELVWLSRSLERLYEEARDQMLTARPDLDEEALFWAAAELVDQGREAWERALQQPASLRVEQAWDYEPLSLRINALYRERYQEELPV